MIHELIWSVEHVMWGPRFLRELGAYWYWFWIKAGIDPDHYCYFCMKEDAQGTLKYITRIK